MRFWTDLSGIQLEDVPGNPVSWIQAIPEGKKYKHPLYGELDFTDQAKLQQFADSVNQKVRGIDLDIDYDHKALTKEAAGWVKGAKYEPGRGVSVLVEWTKEAAQKIKNKAYRYFSPEFVDKWTDPATNVTHQNVLLGGALTNRPFLKDILPVNLSEILNEGEEMDPKLKAAIIKRLGLKKDASDEEVQAALDAEPTTIDLSKAKVDKAEDGSLKITVDGAEGEFVVPAPEAVKADEDEDDEVKKLAETNPAIAKILADAESTKQRLADIEKANKLSEADAAVKSFKNLPPVVTEKLRKIFFAAPTQLSEDLVEVFTKLDEVGLVPQGQQSKQRTTSDETTQLSGDGEAVTKFLDEVDAAMKEDETLSYIDAVSHVREAQPQLYSEYEKAVESQNVEVE